MMSLYKSHRKDRSGSGINIFGHIAFSACFGVLSLVFITSAKCHTPGYIRNYPAAEYQASPTVYNLAINNEGLLFFGTNKGVLLFDGARWELIGISNYSDAKTVEVGPDDRVYIGASGNFGYLEKDVLSGYRYVSISDSISSNVPVFDDVWQIVFLDNDIYFQTYVGIFKWDGKEIDFSPIKEIYIFNIEGQLYASNYLTGEFGRYHDGKIDHISSFPPIENDLVFQVMEYNDEQYILATAEFGLYIFNPAAEQFVKFNSEVNDFMIKNTFWEGIRIGQDLYAMGSWNGGIAFTDELGNDLHVFDQATGLNANHIYDMKLGNNNDLWLATSNGISLISLDPMVTTDIPDPDPALSPTIHSTNFLMDKDVVRASVFEGADLIEEEKFSVEDRDLNLYNAPPSVKIYYAMPRWTGQQVQYSVYLSGYDQNWSDWKKDAVKEYTHLPQGKYTFYVKARKQMSNEESEITAFNLNVFIPWYQSVWLKVFVAVTILLTVGVIVRLMILRLKTQNARLEKMVDERTQNLIEQQAKLSALNKHLKTTNQELDSFVYHTSHDLKAPLKSLLGLLDLAKREDEDLRLLPYHDRMELSIHKLEEFISSIIQYSTNSKSSVELTTIDFNQLVDNSINELQFHDDFSKIEIKRKIHINGFFHSDEKRIQIILNNLLSNAVKYHDKDKKHPAITISITEDASEMVVIEIEDNGLGIKEEMQNKVFSMFYRASEKSYGSGLGLYIISETINKLNGTIKLESEEGQFSRFIIRLPNMKQKVKA